MRLFAAVGLGALFGFMLVWSGMSDPDVIRGALLFEDSYLFLFFGSAVGTAALGQYVLRRGRPEAPERPQRRHVQGSVLFGIGWGISNACPAPIVTQVGMGMGWGAVTLAGVLVGVYLYVRRAEVRAAASTPGGSRTAAGRRATAATTLVSPR